MVRDFFFVNNKKYINKNIRRVLEIFIKRDFEIFIKKILG